MALLLEAMSLKDHCIARVSCVVAALETRSAGPLDTSSRGRGNVDSIVLSNEKAKQGW